MTRSHNWNGYWKKRPKNTRDDGPEWLSTVSGNYEKYYGVRLVVQRWSDIQKKYAGEVWFNSLVPVLKNNVPDWIVVFQKTVSVHRA